MEYILAILIDFHYLEKFIDSLNSQQEAAIIQIVEDLV